MCGRYYIAYDEEDERLKLILRELNHGIPTNQAFAPGEIFPTNLAPVVVRKDDGGSAVRGMRWGFPRVGGGGVVINSRSEKAHVTPMFQKAVRERRCLVPMTGFFEWRRTPGGTKTKEKYAFQTLAAREKHTPMYLAGVYGQFLGGFADGGFDGFAILTQAADEQMAPYHDRMPVIVEGEEKKKALLFAPADTPYEALRGLFAPPTLAITRVWPEEKRS